jgi:ABC-type transport system involved in multi-copper enzyme maturation permease subunit
MTLHGIGLVAGQEVRTRLRTGRWKVLLFVWFLVVNSLGIMFRVSLEGESGYAGGEDDSPVIMFGAMLLAVLVLTLLVVPALSAQSINGDRERGTLATLQVTRLTAGDIALGKLVASWGTGLVILGLALPAALIPVVEGAIGPGRALVVVAIVALQIGIVCAIAQGWSALLARSITSMMMSYLTVFGLLALTPIVYNLALPLTAEKVYSEHGAYGYDKNHSERVWWLLAPNPVVVLADASPRAPKRPVRLDEDYRSESPDPLGGLGREVRQIRTGRHDDDADGFGAAVWPYGMGFNLALAGAAVWATRRRLTIPSERLPKGIRVA